MKLFNKVAILGVGLIGGSIAQAIKKKGLAKEVVGVSRHKKNVLLAKRFQVIDRGSQDLNIIKGADLVILATPVDTIINLGAKVSHLVNEECIVTDVGSTKQKIVSKLEKIFPRYIGTHPLAGSEKRGIANARTVTLKDSLCIFTPTRHTDKEALRAVKRLWVKLGTQIVFVSPTTHDKILSFVSHLAHVASFSLIGTMPTSYLRFASGGLKDTTRIAASDSELWADIFLSNQKNIARALTNFQKHLGKIKSAINNRDKKLLIHILKEAKAKREALG
jgi:prephenate dehydrogenase